MEACPSAEARPRQAQRCIPGGSPGAGAEVPARSSRACAARGVGVSVVVSALTSTTGHNDDSRRLVILFFFFLNEVILFRPPSLIPLNRTNHKSTGGMAQPIVSCGGGKSVAVRLRLVLR